MNFQQALLASWKQRTLLSYLLLPLTGIYALAWVLHHAFYALGIKTRYTSPVPVVVVGNLTVGGTGKTPLIITLVELLQARGLKVGVISRGYKSDASGTRFVQSSSLVEQVGDEPLLICQRTGVAIAVNSDRRQAIEDLLQKHQLDVILSDDGLQHLALRPDLTVCIDDLTTGVSNHWLLPSGSYRQPRSGLAKMDFVIEHVIEQIEMQDRPAKTGSNPRLSMVLKAEPPQPLQEESRVSNNALLPHEVPEWVLVSGIGNPQRFVRTCEQLGYRFSPRVFPDHHAFQQSDFNEFADKFILMTEKDAVKCRELALPNAYYLPVNARLDESDSALLIASIEQLIDPRARHS